MDLLDTVEKGTCTGCGVCTAACRYGAIKMEKTPDGSYAPSVKISLCVDCGNCTAICPALNICPSGIKKERSHRNNAIGSFEEIFTGYSLNKERRYTSTSGGVLPEIAEHLLRKGAIDAVIGLGRREGLFEYVPGIFSDVSELTRAVYIPVPLDTVLKDIDRSKRYLLIGLPCHVHGLKCLLEKDPELKKCIKYVFGLFCSHTISETGVRTVLENRGIDPASVDKLSFRGNGWPGGISISLKDGRTALIANQDSVWSFLYGGYFCSFIHCLCCVDHTNELADISFGDAWLKEVMAGDDQGSSMVIVRDPELLSVLNEMNGSTLALTPSNPNKAAKSQRAPLTIKKSLYLSRKKILTAFGYGEIRPFLEGGLPEKSGFFPAAFNFILLLNVLSGRSYIMRRFAANAGIPILRTLYGIFKALLKKAGENR